MKFDLFVKTLIEQYSNEYKYIGNCVDLFDDAGNCLTNHFSDVSDLAFQDENATEITENLFKNKTNAVNLPNGEYMYFLYPNNLLVAYNISKDIHYFFSK